MRNSKYTREFRDSSIQLVMNSEESTVKIIKDLDVNENTLYNFREYKKANNIPILGRYQNLSTVFNSFISSLLLNGTTDV